MCYPEPLPPTIATFFPEGTVNEIPSRILFPSRYSNTTFSKVISAEFGGKRNTSASGFTFKYFSNYYVGSNQQTRNQQY